jgi:hypothetical protein
VVSHIHDDLVAIALTDHPAIGENNVSAVTQARLNEALSYIFGALS